MASRCCCRGSRRPCRPALLCTPWVTNRFFVKAAIFGVLRRWRCLLLCWSALHLAAGAATNHRRHPAFHSVFSHRPRLAWRNHSDSMRLDGIALADADADLTKEPSRAKTIAIISSKARRSSLAILDGAPADCDPALRHDARAQHRGRADVATRRRRWLRFSGRSRRPSSSSISRHFILARTMVPTKVNNLLAGKCY